MFDEPTREKKKRESLHLIKVGLRRTSALATTFVGGDASRLLSLKYGLVIDRIGSYIFGKFSLIVGRVRLSC